MVNWWGIEDVAEVPAKVWLIGPKEILDNDQSKKKQNTLGNWQPLRKADCQTLNEYSYIRKSTTTNINHNQDDHISNSQTTTTSSTSTTASSIPNKIENKEKDSEVSSVSPSTNNNESQDEGVILEYGRMTAYPKEGRIHFNYMPRQDQRLIAATWFIRLDDDTNQSNSMASSNMSSKHSGSTTNGSSSTSTTFIPPRLVEPIVDVPTTMAIEELYQQAVHATSSFGKGLEESGLLQEQIPISENYHVAIERCTKDGGRTHYVLRKIPNGTWFRRGKSYDLQRGYGSYHIPGEEEEALLGPTNHLVFVIHGIGEAMWSREDVTYTGSIVEDITNFRQTMQRRQINEWKQVCEIAQKEKKPVPPTPNRVEFIPILWYDRVHSSSSSLMKSLQATTLTTIPALREIANDVIFDVLMYMTPNFCYDVLECVTKQIIDMQQLFQKHHPSFLPDASSSYRNSGKFSLMGHSLGSVICWDLLAILREHQTHQENTKLQQQSKKEHWVHIAADGNSTDLGFQSYASNQKGATQVEHGNIGPSLPKPMEHILPFEPCHTIFLGSPAGLFLTLRGAHPVFDALRDKLPNGPGKPKASPFRLPSKCIHNIFHPSDPVAYRIEPLLLVQGTSQDMIPPPKYLTREGQGVRFHIRAKQLGDHIRKSIFETRPTFSSFLNVVSDQAHTLIQQVEDRSTPATDTASTSACEGQPPNNETSTKDAKTTESDDIEDEDNGEIRYPLAGRSGRLDYQLQPNVIDSEYVSAVLAHSSYFVNTDVVDYTIDLMQQ